MICLSCIRYRPQGQAQPISPVCAWKPSPDDLTTLRAILPAPMLSRALVQTAPYQVEECAAFLDNGGDIEFTPGEHSRGSIGETA